MAPTDRTGPARPAGLQLRPAVPQDLSRLHEIFVRSSAGRGQPPESRPPEEVRGWIDGLVVPPLQTWVADVGAPGSPSVEAFVTLRGAWVTLLFVDPDRAGSGLGSALLDLVKGLCPTGFGLRVHEANTDARRFYRSHGLIELERTDGSTYHDAAPDVQMAWPGSDPLAYLRSRIDEVDDELAVLLARRFALTSAVQAHKDRTGRSAGHRGRDPEREREITERMSGHVPGLGRDAVQRIMHAVIEESLDAYERR